MRSSGTSSHPAILRLLVVSQPQENRIANPVFFSIEIELGDGCPLFEITHGLKAINLINLAF
jgi:hypothetical protein